MTAILPLEQLNATQKLMELYQLRDEARRYAAMGAPVLPGIPDIKKIIKDLIESQLMALLEEAKKEIMALLLLVAAGIAEAIIDDVNKVIRTLNKIIRGINRAIDSFMPLAKGVFTLIVALSIVYVVAKIICMIPSPGAGMGAVVVFDMFKSVAMEIMQLASSLLDILWPIGFAILAALLLLVSLFAFLDLLRGFLSFLAAAQKKQESDAKSSALLTSDEWNDRIGNNSVTDGETEPLVECTLPSGEVKMMTADECLTAGGTFPGMELLSKLNELNGQIASLQEMVDCLLPDGTIEQLPLDECLARGGRALSQEELNRLLAERDALLSQLGDLSGITFDNNQIISLLNLHQNVTIENTTENKGKRYGFYQSEKDI